MSKRLDVLRAIAALVDAAGTGAQVVGVDDDAGEPTTVPAGGRVIIDAGDPGTPQFILSPLTYIWTHRVPLIVVADEAADGSAEQAVDTILMAIGDAIEADRTLGGRADWLDAEAAQTSDVVFDVGPSPRRADAVLVVTYETTTPFG